MNVPLTATKEADTVNHNSVVLACSNIPISTFSSGFFNNSQHIVLSMKLGTALDRRKDSLNLIACQSKDCPKFHCLSVEGQTHTATFTEGGRCMLADSLRPQCKKLN